MNVEGGKSGMGGGSFQQSLQHVVHRVVPNQMQPSQRYRLLHQPSFPKSIRRRQTPDQRLLLDLLHRVDIPRIPRHAVLRHSSPSRRRRSILGRFRRFRALVELPVDEKVAERTGRTPRYSVGPALDTGRLLVPDEDGSRNDGPLLLRILQSPRDERKYSRGAALNDDEGVQSRFDVAVVGGVRHPQRVAAALASLV